MSEIKKGRLKEEACSGRFRVYHAHGFVIRNENGITGEEIWNKDSAFSEVFFGFEEAKNYLLRTFEDRFADVCLRDSMLESYFYEEGTVDEMSPEWRREYVEEYIRYKLIISEKRSDFPTEAGEINFAEPERIDWLLRFDGEVLTRFYVLGEKRYECRESDLLDEAGTKFKTGDLVIYKDCENRRGCEDIFVVLTPPDKPENAKIPWVNKYKLIYIKDMNKPDFSGRLEIVNVHEDDLTPCSADYLEGDYYKETIRSLQWVVKDEKQMPPELKTKILRGAVLSDLIK